MFSFLTKPITFDFKSNAFDFIRLFLALAVVVYHSTLYYEGVVTPDWAYYPISGWKFNQTHLGEIAVHGFFVISGFLITASMLRSVTVGDFFKKRFVRLYPGFITAIFLTAFAFAPLMAIFQGKINFGSLQNWSLLTKEALTYFFRNMFVEIQVKSVPLVQPWDINGSLWTLWQELRAYALVAFLFAIGWLQKRNIVLGIALATNLLYFACTKILHLRDIFDTIFYDFRFLSLIVYFLSGVIFYLYFDKIKWNWRLFIFSILGIIVGVAGNIGGLLFPVCGGYAILFLSQIIPIRDLSKRIGDYSYGVYIYSTPIQLAMFYSGYFKSGMLIYTIVAIILSLFAGFLSWNFVEKRFLKHR
jgi:peptidoglycan/LPS O-acetylase OafA/YrhL